MEDNNNTEGQETTTPSPLPIPQITLESLEFLHTTALWTKFLAIIGFIGLGIMLVVGLFMGSFFSDLHNSLTPIHLPFSMYWFVVVYIIFVAANVFPVIYMNNLSNYMRKAVALRETELLTTALENIKKYFTCIGILTILMIVINILFAILAIYLLSTVTSIPQSINLYLPH